MKPRYLLIALILIMFAFTSSFAKMTVDDFEYAKKKTTKKPDDAEPIKSRRHLLTPCAAGRSPVKKMLHDRKFVMMSFLPQDRNLEKI